MDIDTIIVGAGIAGASAALVLAKTERVLLIEAREPASGASGVAGGLFSPMLALRGRPIWRMQEAIDAFQAQLDDASAHELFDNRGVLRPARDEEQVQFFLDSVSRCPEEAEWLSPEESMERYPNISAPWGSMYIRRAGAINLADYVNHLVAIATQRSVETRMHTRVVDWGEDADRAFVDLLVPNLPSPQTERIYARRVILAPGKFVFLHSSFSELSLHAVKGQTVRVTITDTHGFESIPPVSGTCYIIPQNDHFAIGSSFQHKFANERPSEEISKELINKASKLAPFLRDATCIDAQVGIRVSVPGIRMPLVGPLPGYRRIHVFTAFGSKGLLLGPLLASQLPHYLTTPSSIPTELRPRLK